MTRLKAREAKNIAETINSTIYSELKDKIDSLIRNACEKGLYSIYIDDILPQEVINYLRDLGYNVRVTDYRNEYSCNISWR